MSYTVDPIEAKVYMVRVAEQAELYDDMLNFMEPIVVEKAASMTQDDRTLFGVAAKNYIAQDRRTHRTISVVKTYNQFERYIPLLDEYLDKVIIRLTQKCQRVIDLIRANFFSPEEEGVFDSVLSSLDYDHYMLAADFDSYYDVQQDVASLYTNSPDEWTTKTIINMANMGWFSSDRTIDDYAKKIWNVKPVPVK